jgi:hypothetical protein
LGQLKIQEWTTKVDSSLVRLGSENDSLRSTATLVLQAAVRARLACSATENEPSQVRVTDTLYHSGNTK